MLVPREEKWTKLFLSLGLSSLSGNVNHQQAVILCDHCYSMSKHCAQRAQTRGVSLCRLNDGT